MATEFIGRNSARAGPLPPGIAGRPPSRPSSPDTQDPLPPGGRGCPDTVGAGEVNLPTRRLVHYSVTCRTVERLGPGVISAEGAGAPGLNGGVPDGSGEVGMVVGLALPVSGWVMAPSGSGGETADGRRWSM